MRQDQTQAELHSRMLEESLSAVGREQERLALSSKEVQHAREVAKQVRRGGGEGWYEA